MPQQHYYRLGLNQTGEVVFVLDILAENLREAKDEWARLTGHIDPCWDAKRQTYFGWSVVIVKEEPLPRNPNPILFRY